MEKKKKFPLEIRRNQIKENFIPEAYFLPHLKAFYKGEWVFDKNIGEEGENVPGGLGRLYEENFISEGLFLTFYPQNKAK